MSANRKTARDALILGFGLVASAGCTPESASSPPTTAERTQPVVYGEDDRTDWYAVADARWRDRLARSAVALVPRGSVSTDAETGVVTLSGQVYGEHFDLCAGQPFFDQRRVARCSGTLIAPDLVLTAGHCVPGPNRCADRRFVFNYQMIDAATEAPLSADDVYRCAEILVSRDDDRFGQRLDFAVVRLDRPVVGDRAPAPVRLADVALERGSDLNLLGFPNGLPAKFAPNGAVVNARAGRLDYFDGSVDAFGGNSGSGVYDADGRVVGILVRGATDYATTPEGCDVVNALPKDRTEEEGAEDITYVARALEGLCATGFGDPVLCPPGEGRHCAACVVHADCAAGFDCVEQPEAPAFAVCAPACRVDADCRPDHRCADTHCVPRVAVGCEGGDVVTHSACGPVVALNRVCPGGSRCFEGACQVAPVGDRCADAVRLAPLDQRVTGNPGAEGFTDLSRATCGGEGADVVFAFGTVAPMDFEAVAQGYDTILSLRRGCEGAELACVDDSDPPAMRGSRVAVAALPAGDYRLILDAYDEDSGDFTLDLRFGPAACEGVCVPGTATCADAASRLPCVADGAGCGQLANAEACTAGSTCTAGVCVAPAPDAAPPDSGVIDAAVGDAAADAGRSDAGRADAERADLGLTPADGAAPDRGEDAAAMDGGIDGARHDSAVEGDWAIAADSSRADGGSGPSRSGSGAGCSTLAAASRDQPGGSPAWWFLVILVLRKGRHWRCAGGHGLRR